MLAIGDARWMCLQCAVKPLYIPYGWVIPSQDGSSAVSTLSFTLEVRFRRMRELLMRTNDLYQMTVWDSFVEERLTLSSFCDLTLL